MASRTYSAQNPVATQQGPGWGLRLIAWGVTLLIAALPDIVFLEFDGGKPSWLIGAKLGLLVLLMLASFGWRMLQPLRPYWVVLVVILLAPELFYRMSQTRLWQQWFHYPGATFGATMLGEQGIRLAISGVVMVTLLLLGFSRADFFLVKGQLDAPATPEWIFGMQQAEPWTRFGWKFLLGAVVALGIFLGAAAWSMRGQWSQSLALLPVVLLLAMLNAFHEELTYRAALLAPLHSVVGDRQAIYIAATFFGLGHYTGVPYGVTGVLMAAFLGWALGKAVLETRGFLWAWFIHVVMDVMIFSVMAVGAITAGGA